MKLYISPKQVQVLSPNMILSMEILQMGAQELSEYIETAVQENPVLEAAESSEEYDESQGLLRKMEWLMDSDPQNQYYHREERELQSDLSRSGGTAAEREEDLYSHILSQLRSIGLEPQLMCCAELLAGCLDQNGRLDEDIALLAKEFGQPPKMMERALTVLQSLEPAGIGARSLSECLCLQLKRRMPVDRLALSIAAEYLEALAKNQYGLIARALGTSQADVRRAAGVIRSLEPRPGAAFAPKERVGYIVPDIVMTTFPDHFELSVNERFSPSLSISPYYVRLMKESGETEVRDYLTGRARQAKWLISAINQRRNTLLSCAECIVQLQNDFFRQGPGHLHPLSLSDVAQIVGIHESTVSRAVRDKYLQCSMGVYPLSYFFVRRLGAGTEGNPSSPDAAKALLKALIAQEDKSKPLSDQKLCELMAEQGCTLSRRTVAKYRDELNIPGTAGRRC